MNTLNNSFATTAAELVAKASNIPPVPYAALKLVNLLDHPSSGNDEVVEVLKCDNILTSKLLRACNSSQFGFAEPVLSVDQAVFLLGHKQILQIVLSIALAGTMKASHPCYTMDADELWMHSFMAATAGEAIATEFPELNVEPSVAFTAGLLHDIGKLVLGIALSPEQLAEIRERVQELQISRFGAEKAVLATDHSEVGACLLREWALPAELVAAVAHHHMPILEPAPDLSVVAYLADFIAHLAGPTPRWEGYTFRMNHRVATQLHLTGDRLETLVSTVRTSFDGMDLFMNMG